MQVLIYLEGQEEKAEALLNEISSDQKVKSICISSLQDLRRISTSKYPINTLPIVVNILDESELKL
jgi:hypothetical protein